MRVALLSRDTNSPNGFSTYTRYLYRGLLQKGVEVELIPSISQDSRFKVPTSGSLLSPILYDVILPAKHLLKKINADVYHALFESKGIFFPLLKGGKIITFHHIPPGRFPFASSPIDYLFGIYWKGSMNIGIKNADHIIAVSEQTKREVINRFNIPKERVTTVHHGISSQFRPLNVKKPFPTVGYIGGLGRRKNVDFLIRSFYILCKKYDVPNTKLIIGGQGPHYERLCKLVKKLGITIRVEFRGYIPSKKLVETYNSFNVFAFPSLHEGFGFPILEA